MADLCRRYTPGQLRPFYPDGDYAIRIEGAPACLSFSCLGLRRRAFLRRSGRRLAEPGHASSLNVAVDVAHRHIWCSGTGECIEQAILYILIIGTKLLSARQGDLHNDDSR